MGFTESAYPDLPIKIEAQISSSGAGSGALTKNGEDDIVTTLLEELLTTSPRPPAASGSGLRDNVWH